jgi:arylsulfatase A-like enzyme
MVPEGQVDVTFEKARRWLERNRDRHFFLFLHTYQVHTPYAPPAAYGGLFAEHAGEIITKASPPHWRLRRDYDREIRYVDDELRGLFAHLATLGLDRDTVFIVVSDHGEEFLDHGRFEHGTQNFQEAVHVPLLFTGPGIPRGNRIATPVTHADLLPTILDLLGLPEAPKWGAQSLLRLIEGTAPEGLEERALFSESPDSLGIGADGFVVEVLSPAYGVRRGRHKVARYRTEKGFRYEYYDLVRDPEERHDLFAERGHEVADLVARLDGYEHASHALRKRIEREVGAGAREPEIRLEPAQEQKLRALGYLE